MFKIGIVGDVGHVKVPICLFSPNSRVAAPSKGLRLQCRI